MDFNIVRHILIGTFSLTSVSSVVLYVLSIIFLCKHGEENAWIENSLKVCFILAGITAILNIPPIWDIITNYFSNLSV